ncbi:MAG: IclR family transcriptional regulator [Proteobacteria bacterium]|nr:IclR family transcriptional regulator [Pseudomonadota bacterium]
MRQSLSSSAASAATTGSSAERSLRLLAFITGAGRPLTLAEIATGLGLPKATAHRLCNQLLQMGFIARDIDERAFAVGPALRKLAFDALTHSTVRGLRHALLTDLVARLGETCNFTTLDGVEVLYLDRVEAPWPWRLQFDVGVHVPLHCTASGKLFLASMNSERRARILGQLEFARLTPNTLTTAAALRKDCERTAANGYAVDMEEFIAGLIAVAVPVRDAVGEVRAAIAMHGPVTRLSLDGMLKHLPALKVAAGRMSLLL